MSLQKLIQPLIATLMCWLTIGLVVMVTDPGAFVRDAVIVIAVLASVAMWGTWAASGSTGSDTAAGSEKAKRRAGSDANVALLLELLSEDERREVKERLIDRLQSDGETTSLTDFLAEESAQAKRSR